MKTSVRVAALAAALGSLSTSARAAEGAAQGTDWSAILIFLAFVIVTLVITYWAAQHTHTTKDFYAAGGGITGQADACKLGIARALKKSGEDMDKLRENGLLTRDGRMKERKKYGLRGARRGTQFSKR